MLIDNVLGYLQIAPFDPTKKKKKKKVVIQDPSDEVDKLAEKAESLAGLSSMLQKRFHDLLATVVDSFMHFFQSASLASPSQD